MNEEPKGEFIIKRATRHGVKPLIGLYGKSNGGKTRSALILARGLVGPKGKIGLIDTEHERGSIFADVIDGGYGVINLASPFSPDRYTQAIEAVESESDIVVIDSMSHSWEGEGGVLEMHEAELDRMAGDDFQKRNTLNFPAWRKPKFEHARMVQRILRSSKPVICCLRAKEKSRMGKDAQGKKTVVTDEYPSPIFDEAFIFEMLINGEVYASEGKGGYLRITKCTHEDMFDCLPKQDEQISYRHGELLAQWCANAGSSPAKAAQEPKPVEGKDDVKALKNQLWKLLKPVRGKESNWKVAQQWLIDEMCLDPELTVAELTIVQFKSVISIAAQKLGVSNA